MRGRQELYIFARQGLRADGALLRVKNATRILKRWCCWFIETGITFVYRNPKVLEIMPVLYQFLALNQAYSHKQRKSRILRKLFAIGISMQNESRFTEEMVHNGKSRPTFDLYSSPSTNPRKLPLRQLANSFRMLSVRETFNVRDCAKLGPAHPRPLCFTCEEKMERTVDWPNLKTWPDICGIAVVLHRMPNGNTWL